MDKKSAASAATRPSFFHHLHPPTTPALQARWRYTLGAGGTAVFLTIIVCITGVMEMFYYNPSPEQAALSVQTISYLIPFGSFVRGLHYWAAQLLLAVSGLHLARIVYTGAYRPPRRFNYLLGLALFVILILLDFTGYVLRWDQGVYWAYVAGTNLLKSIPFLGDFLYRAAAGNGDATSALLRFYTWHIFGLMSVAGVLVTWHVFRVRRDGGICVPPANLRGDTARITRDELVRREILAMLLIGSGLMLLANFAPAPIAPQIGEQAGTAIESRAPWFFLWVQQMLRWGNPFLWGVLVPLLVLAVLAVIPFVLPQPSEAELGQWFPKSSRLAQITLGTIAITVAGLSILALLTTNGN